MTDVMMNAPGQASISYRTPRHAALRASMLRALGADLRLRSFTARVDDEPLVALVDAWAAVLSVAGFHHDRIANEGFIGTSVDRESVLQLARAIGYELRPGVAATTWLSFTVSAPDGAPATLPVAAGTRVQSVPGPDEKPQVFETTEAIVARPAWNEIPARAVVPHEPAVGESTLRLLGTDLVLSAGDPILVLGKQPSPWFDVRRVLAAEVGQAVATSNTDLTDLVAAHTVVTLDGPLTSNTLPSTLATDLDGVEVHVLRQRAALFGYNAQPWSALPLPLRVGELHPLVGVEAKELQLMMIANPPPASGTPPVVNAGAVGPEPVPKAGGSAKISSTTNDLLVGAYAHREKTWADAVFAVATAKIYLDQTYPAVVADSWLVLERDNVVTVRRTAEVAEVPHTDFGLSGKVTRITLEGGDAAGFAPKTTTVSIVSERLKLAPWPVVNRVGSAAAGRDRIDLGRSVAHFQAGRTIAIRGQNAAGTAVSEVATIDRVVAGSPGPTLYLDDDLTNEYTPLTARVLGNVAKATHGESRAEVLGSGDRTVRFARFTLSHTPLTHVTARTGTGSDSTLAVWVNGVRWSEVVTFHRQAPDASVYTTRLADDGTVTVMFGDGETGSRLPTGVNNVVATYRVGIGTDAVLGADRLTLPMSRPLGLDAVVNPVAATGAADPEVLAEARTNAPRTVRTLGRVVSVADYTDFARSFAGVGKARGDELWDGARRIVHLTIAGQGGVLLPATSAIPADLLGAINKVRHAIVPVSVRPHVPRTFVLALRLVASTGHRWETVAASLRASLIDHFSSARREFAQPVAASEIIAVAHAARGVEAVVLTALHRVGETVERAEALPAAQAQYVAGQAVAAELLTIDSTALSVVKA